MNDSEEFRQKNIFNILSSAKLASIFFCILVVYSKILIVNKIMTNSTISYLDITGSTLLTCTIVPVYLLWSFFSKRALQFRDIRVIQIVESLIFVVIFSIMVYISNSYISQYKFLFLLVIITSTIQTGMKYGMIISISSSAIVLIMDLIYAPSFDINLYFQNDLILAGVFIVTAWSLGHYVEIENEHLRQKNSELKELNNKLIKQDKQRKYFEEIIFNNDSCYNLLIENSNDAIFIHRNGNLIFGNKSAVNLLGFKENFKLSGSSILDFTPLDEKSYIKEKFEEIYNKKLGKLFFEERVVRNNGDVVIVQNTSTYFVYEGQPTILSILRDITSEKQVEKLQMDVEKNLELLNESREFNKLTTEFFANISHELKTPLNVIFSAIQILNLNDSTEEKFAKKHDMYLKIIKKNCYRLLRLINNLIDMTKLDSGFIKLQLQNYNIVSIVEEITLSVISFAESRGINIIFDTNVEERVMAFDIDKMERIILNLLSNAIKFTDPGGNIYVNLIDMDKDIVISIKDTGVGIPENKLQMIFERFAQVDKTFNRNREGSGIGLSLVKSLVELHEGTINIKSKIGSGSEFIIKLPVKTIESEYTDTNLMQETNIDRINIELSDIYMDFE